jgi:excinuclease ABC subunit C
MKDEADLILYVGKAKNLKNRLTTYFQPAVHEVGRTEIMVHRVHHFDIILTETESEALILECTLIKKHKPKYNIRLKDDKAYPYIKVNLQDPYPRLEWTRRVQKEGARYFGPFPSAWSAREVLRLLTETFKLRDCSDNTFRHRSRPCILYQMGKCPGPCVGLVSSTEYHEVIGEAIQILEGKGDDFIATLEKGMFDASARMEYEQAAHYRDQIKNLKLVTETQGVVQAGKDVQQDIIGIARRDLDAHAAVLQIRHGRLLSVQHFQLQNTQIEMSDWDILEEFLALYYTDSKPLARKKQAVAFESEDSRFIVQRPKEVLVSEFGGDVALYEKTLSLNFRVPENREEEQLIQVARANADHALEMSQKKDAGHGLAALEDVRTRLHLEALPLRMECYDISNFGGDESVASRVVFVDGAPDKSLYRRYKIKTVQGANDFAMMKEVLGRRFSRKDDPFPQLVVVDGGKGQLAQALAIFEELNIQGVEVVGLAKARAESNFQAKEVKSSMERIFLPNRVNPVSLLPHTPAFKILTHLRDEAHRFAITYHRKLRDRKSMQTSD